MFFNHDEVNYVFYTTDSGYMPLYQQHNKTVSDKFSEQSFVLQYRTTGLHHFPVSDWYSWLVIVMDTYTYIG